MENPLFQLTLPKWPECRVKGKTVTREQAAEIIIRTQDFWFTTNDNHFASLLYSEAGIDYVDNTYPHVNFDQVRETREKYGCLDLEYLINERICSSYIGGPNGWINWEGQIQQFGKNIGKWPSVETVYEEWVKIAEAFPFLELVCQLFSGEGCEEETNPVVEFVISGGKVELKNPGSPIFDGIKPNNIDDFVRAFSNPRREQGCTVDQFCEALKITLEAKKLKENKGINPPMDPQ